MDLALINASSYFGYGLTFALVGLLCFSPYTDKIDALKEYYEKKKGVVIVAVISILLSVVIFLYGMWDTIGSLKELLTSS